MRREWQWGVGSLLALLAGATLATPPARPVLRPCGGLGALCGSLERPLDSSGRVAGRIRIAFELYPATGPDRRIGTLVATEGGPGYAATDSREAYLALLGPLRADHDLVLMDNRGTGRSGAIHCALAGAGGRLSTDAIGRCGRRLGPRAALYGTADAADDLEAILEALDTGPVDLYGDSYGTFFAQVFALRHPQRLRALVLDGAYPLDGPDIAWLPDYAPAMRAKFDLACQRDPRCAALPGRASERLAAALPALRAHPRPGLDPAAYATVLFASAPALATLREADAAARAVLAGDPRPLARLAAEAAVATRAAPTDEDPSFSAALAAAVTCTDTPQVVDAALAPAARRAAFALALAARERAHPDAFAPFRYAEFLGMPADYRYLDQCLDWPAADPSHPAAYRLATTRTFAPLPVLVLSGDLDNITSVAEGTAAAAAWPAAHHAIIANGLHVNALPHGRSHCAAERVRQFLVTLAADATPCAAPAVRLVPVFARRALELAPVTPAAGDASRDSDRRLAAAALATVADVLPRGAPQAGLRGGSVRPRAAPDGMHWHLQAVRWCVDVAVSGEVHSAGDGGAGEAALTLVAADGTRGTLTLRWPAGGTDAVATLAGTVGGRTLAAQAPAP